MKRMLDLLDSSKRQLTKRKIVGYFARKLFPQFSWCFRCGRTWNVCKSHSTMFSENDGCFPLCVDCWSDLTIDKRLPYYILLVREWMSLDSDYNGVSWDVIETQIITAVMAGK